MTQEWALSPGEQTSFEAAVERKVSDLVFGFPVLLEKYGRDWFDEWWPAGGDDLDREVFEAAVLEAVRLLGVRLGALPEPAPVHTGTSSCDCWACSPDPEDG